MNTRRVLNARQRPNNDSARRIERRRRDRTHNVIGPLTLNGINHHMSPQVTNVRNHERRCYRGSGRRPMVVDRVLPGMVGGPPSAIRWNSNGTYRIGSITRFRPRGSSRDRLIVRIIGIYTDGVDADEAWIRHVGRFNASFLCAQSAIDHVYHTVVNGIYGCLWI